MLEEAIAAPELMLIETTNVLRKLATQKKIGMMEANAAHRDLRRLQVQMFPSRPLAERVWALRGKISSYDACYVALAESLNASIATLDQKLARGASEYCDFLLPSAQTMSTT